MSISKEQRDQLRAMLSEKAALKALNIPPLGDYDYFTPKLTHGFGPRETEIVIPKCDYCGTRHSNAPIRCPSCGAPR